MIPQHEYVVRYQVDGKQHCRRQRARSEKEAEGIIRRKYPNRKLSDFQFIQKVEV